VTTFCRPKQRLWPAISEEIADYEGVKFRRNFRLTDEPISEPPQLLQKIWRERGLDESKAHVLKIGESAMLATPAHRP